MESTLVLGGQLVSYTLPPEGCSFENALLGAEAAHYTLMSAQQRLFDKYPGSKADIEEQLRHTGAAFGASLVCGTAAIGIVGVLNEVIYPRNYRIGRNRIFAADTQRDFRNNSIGFQIYGQENRPGKSRDQVFRDGVTRIWNHIFYTGPTRKRNYR